MSTFSSRRIMTAGLGAVAALALAACSPPNENPSDQKVDTATTFSSKDSGSSSDSSASESANESGAASESANESGAASESATESGAAEPSAADTGEDTPVPEAGQETPAA